MEKELKFVIKNGMLFFKYGKSPWVNLSQTAFVSEIDIPIVNGEPVSKKLKIDKENIDGYIESVQFMTSSGAVVNVLCDSFDDREKLIYELLEKNSYTLKED